MNDDAEYIYNEINRFVLLLRTERDVENKQKHLDEINRLNLEYKELHETE